MKYLVTGGLGFLGHHVVDALLAEGHAVVVVDNLEPTCGGDMSRKRIGVTVYGTDIAEYANLERVISYEKPDVILHLAAYGRNLNCRDFSERAYIVNVVGTHNILHIALLNNIRTIVCSSNIVLSDQDTVYKQTKLHCEQLIREFSRKGLSVMGLRPSNIYGSGQSRTEYQPCAFAGLDMSFERDGHFTITGDGMQSRDFTHADDVADAFVVASQSSVSGCTLDVATGEQISMNEVAELLGAPIVYTDPRPGDAKTLVSNIEPAKALLMFKTKRKLKDHIFEAFPSVARKYVK